MKEDIANSVEILMRNTNLVSFSKIAMASLFKSNFFPFGELAMICIGSSIFLIFFKHKIFRENKFQFSHLRCRIVTPVFLSELEMTDKTFPCCLLKKRGAVERRSHVV